MIQTVNNILKPLGVPTLFMLRPKIDATHKLGISYHFFNERNDLYGDGQGAEFGVVLQIDVFSLIDYSDIVEQIKVLMKTNKFRLADSRDSEDGFSTTEYYHKILIFNYVEREV